jgi:hypothetical protein
LTFQNASAQKARKNRLSLRLARYRWWLPRGDIATLKTTFSIAGVAYE